MDLLERDPLLHALEAALDATVSGAGRIVLVRGEAGVGKTSLVDRFAAAHRGRVLTGACEALFTPRPLGPLHDVAHALPDDALRAPLAAGADRPALFAATLDVLRRPGGPHVLVVEDAHWADEATLDWLKFLGRRLPTLPALLVVTYRDEEVGAEHPLRFVLGDLPPRHTVRLDVPPLSEAAVGALARAAGYAGADLHARTDGNPFFVTEVLANGEAGVPASVRDAVLARAARLSAPARALLDLVAVVPGRAPRPLLDAVLAPDADAVEEGIATGVLRADAGGLAFRHELARQAVEEALPPPRRAALHAAVLAALRRGAAGPVPAAALAHHAAAAGDAPAVLALAPRAAEEAAALGAHREAAAHLATALAHAGGLAPAARAALLDRLAYEHYLTGRIDRARAAREDTLALYDRLGDRLRYGDALRWLSRLHWFLGHKAEAERYADAALRALDGLPDGPERAMALSNRAQLHMLSGEAERAVFWGAQAVALAERLGATETLAHALNNVGTARLLTPDEAGWADLDRSLRLALDHGFEEHAARAYTNLGTAAVGLRRYDRAARDLGEGIAYATDRDLDSWTHYMTAWRARLRFERGDWAGAADDAGRVLAAPHVATVSRIPALAVLGHVRVRRGDPPAGALDEARALAEGTGEVQRIAPVAAARAEAAWLRGRPDAVRAEAAEAFALARAHDDGRSASELAFWLWRAGGLDRLPPGAERPYALHAAGRWRAAAEAWAAWGCPYERALALADGDEPAQREALAAFEALGAAPAADALRRRMRAGGVRRVPRGPRPATRDHPAGLTARQADVLALLAEGLTTAALAERLFISAKTADHHVSAVLEKLGARSRAEALARAREAGLLGA